VLKAVYTTIDLSQGFFQMELDPQSSKYTAFNSCFGTFKFQTGLVIGKSSLGSTVQIIPWLRSSSRG
jgi:hypothetical protein